MSARPLRALFTGYAPVHFVCFRPLYERLVAEPGVEVIVSGGRRTRIEGTEYEYDLERLYDRFGVPTDRRMPVEALADERFDVLFAANTKMIEPGEVGTRVQIFHGISYRNKAIRSDNLGCDHYFLVGPYMRRRFVEAGFLGEEDPRAVPVGFMKTDCLLNGELDRSRLLEQSRFDGTRPVVLYAPTGAKHNSLETVGYEVIDRLVRADRFDLIVKPHDHPKNRAYDAFARLAHFERPHVRIARNADVVPLLFVADLLISDASSVSSEYSLLDRPMVFLDVPRLLRASEKADPSLDLETWGRRGGEIVENPGEIVDVVSASLADPHKHGTVRRSMAQDLFYNPGGATDAAFQWVRSHLSARSAAATR